MTNNELTYNPQFQIDARIRCRSDHGRVSCTWEGGEVAAIADELIDSVFIRDGDLLIMPGLTVHIVGHDAYRACIFVQRVAGAGE